MKRKLILKLFVFCMFIFKTTAYASHLFLNGSSDSVSIKVDSVIAYSNYLKICLTIINSSNRDIAVVKPLSEYLNYGIVSVDFINKRDFKKGFNSNQLSKNIQIDKIYLKDSSSFFFIKPNGQQSAELLIDKDFFVKDSVFDFVKNCYLVIWYFHDTDVFQSKIHIDKIYNGIISSISSSIVRTSESLASPSLNTKNVSEIIRQ